VISGELKAEESLKLGEVTLIPIFEVATFSAVQKGAASFVGSKTPVAIVVLRPSETEVLGMNGERISLEI